MYNQNVYKASLEVGALNKAVLIEMKSKSCNHRVSAHVIGLIVGDQGTQYWKIMECYFKNMENTFKFLPDSS